MSDRDYYLQHPNKQLFYKVLSNISTPLNTGYNSWWGLSTSRPVLRLYHFHRWIVMTFAKLVFISQLLFIILNYKTIDSYELIVAMTITPVGFLAMVKVQIGRSQKLENLMKNFMNETHIYNSYLRNKESDYVKTKVVQVERLSRFTAYFLSALITLCWFTFMMEPVVYNIKHYNAIMNHTTNFHYCIYICVPFDYKYNLFNFICLHSVCMYLGFVGVVIIWTFDSVNFIFVYHLVGHIYILKYNIQTNWSDEFDDQETKQFLVYIIKYHSFIIRTFKNVQEAFEVNVAANYFQNSAEDGLLLYQLMLGDKEYIMTYGLMIVVYLGDLVIMSIVLEEIRRQNSDLSDYVYAIPWQKMSISNQKLVILLLGRTQTDMVFKAACGMKAGVEPALSIIKSMFSYYVMIKSRM